MKSLPRLTSLLPRDALERQGVLYFDASYSDDYGKGDTYAARVATFKLRRSIDRGGGTICRVHRLALRHLPDVSQRRDGKVGPRQTELPET